MSSPDPLALAQLIDMQFGDDPSLIGEGLLPDNGIMLIGGPPKSYKSFLLGAIAFNLATGCNLFGVHSTEHGRTTLRFPIRKPSTVLIVEQEIGWYDLQDRYRRMYGGLQPPQQVSASRNIFFASCDRSLRLDTFEGLGAFSKLIESCRPDVLCLDPLIEFHAGDESTEMMVPLFRNLDALRERYKLAVVICHHKRKGQPGQHSDDPEEMRGAQYVFGKGDSFLMCRVINRDAGIIQIAPTIRRGKPIRAFQVKLDWNTLLASFHAWKKGE